MLLFKDEIRGIEIHKGLNPYREGKGDMIHIMSTNEMFKEGPNTSITGLCIDLNGNIVRQTFDKKLNKCFYNVYKDDNHKIIIENIINDESLKIEDIVYLSKRN